MEVLMTHITRKGLESSKRKTIARRQFLHFLAGSMLGAVMLSGTHAWAQGNAIAGKTVFENQCASCHSTEPGGSIFGRCPWPPIRHPAGLHLHARDDKCAPDLGCQDAR